MEENNMKENESTRSNILSKENGFNTRVNLFIIRYLYYHMKKHSKFMKMGNGKRQASIDINEYIGISRQRFNRIFHGYNFEITEKESKDISGLFNISADYFKKDGNLIEIHGIDRNDWKCYFANQYKNSVEMDANNTTTDNWMKYTPKERMASAIKVDETLQEFTKKDFVANHYDAKTALFRIYYFFENYTAFREVSTFNKFRKNLELLKISDWKELESNPTDMKKCFLMLEKHYEYVKAYLKCRELEKID